MLLTEKAKQKEGQTGKYPLTEERQAKKRPQTAPKPSRLPSFWSERARFGAREAFKHPKNPSSTTRLRVRVGIVAIRQPVGGNQFVAEPGRDVRIDRCTNRPDCHRGK